MRERAGSVAEISVIPTGISVSGLEIVPYEHLHFRDRADIIELFFCSSTMKFGIVLFDS